ncbi:MAG: Uma2 family endonuclease [Planctomycetaceae bacterium]|nr:Uma2 family endonuclease [Planctomycetaceae bacterium]
MSSAEKLDWIDTTTYLRREADSAEKVEYVDGTLRAMTGSTNRHHLIATNATGLLFSQLQGKPCRVYNSDTRIRIRHLHATWFYFPDASVVCLPNAQNDLFQDRPVMVVEVLSLGTRANDLDEKLRNYLSISSLEYYLILEQIAPEAFLMRRVENGFLRETYESLAAVIDLPAIGCQIPLNKIYADIDLSPDAVREEIPNYNTETCAVAAE